MDFSKIHFFKEDIVFTLSKRKAVKEWIHHAVKEEGFIIDNLNIIFCSDDYLLEINKSFLNHDYYTDIITFDSQSDKRGRILGKRIISGDIFISYDRVKDNAESLMTGVEDELHRVIIHGVLHLSGYKDKTAKDKTAMTAKEDYYLSLRSFR